MRNFMVVLAAGLILSPAAVAAEQESHAVAELAWLAGCWASVGAEHGSGEQWTLPAGGTMFGVSRTVRGAATVAHEFMQIRQADDQRIEFIARPSGQAGGTFEMIALEQGEVVFENLDNDFPQRIIYFRTSDGDIGARIEGEIGGEVRSKEFPLKRVSCTAAENDE